MYFQVCSKSACQQHSGERYRTNGPLIIEVLRQASHTPEIQQFPLGRLQEGVLLLYMYIGNHQILVGRISE